MKYFKNFKGAIVILFVAYFSGCSSSEKICSLPECKQKIINYYESGAFYEEINKITDKELNDYKNISLKENDCVVFDIDETALDNYIHIKNNDFGYDPEKWKKWVLQAEAPAINGVKRMYDFYIEKGAKIVFITGRKYDEYEATKQNLIKVGYVKFDTIITRNLNEKEFTAAEYKSLKRKELTEKGYNIILNVGDQYSDLEGGNSQRQIKLPNYLYYIK